METEVLEKPFECRINSLNVLYYSLVQIGVPLIDSFVLINNDEEKEIKDIRVKVEFDFDFIENYEEKIEVLEPETFVELDVKLSYKAKKIFELTEKVIDTFKISVLSGEEVLYSEERKISVLPTKQWTGISVFPETISSFVMPNIPEVSLIVARAGEILNSKTGDSSFTGYMTGNKNRVMEQLAAIYAAIYELNIVYSSLPATFEQIGQRVRTPQELYNLRQGNCIEMSVLFASVCESVGLNPFVVIVEGHAFVGSWLTDELFDTNVEYSSSELNKRLATGINDIVVLEATYMNRDSGKNFEQATRAALKHLEDEAKFHASIDIRRCHYLGITPMPVLSSENGEIKVIDYGYASDAETTVALGADIEEYFIDTNQKVEATKSSIWMKNMLDLSKRNNLISFRPSVKNIQLFSSDLSDLEDSLSKGESFTFTEVTGNLKVGRKSNRVVEIENEKELMLEISKADFKAKKIRTYMEEEDMNFVLKNIYRETQKSIEENGSSSLFLALGFLKWFDPKDTIGGIVKYRYAPLVLVPVELIRKNLKSYEIRLRDEDSQMNVTLLEFLRQNYNLTIGGLNPLPEDENGVDIKLVFNSIRKAIMNQKGWDVVESAVVGNFSFSQFVMWNDLKDRFDKLSENKIVKGLVDGFYIPEESRSSAIKNIDEKLEDRNIIIPFSTDSSQLESVIESVEGSSFVLHGPPGTGKSQTITSMIANALYNGKSVLFVAEKMAALNVVYDRLSKLGLEEYILELHSNKTSRRVVLEKFETSLNTKSDYDSENFDRKNTKLISIGKQLNNEVIALHNVHSNGYSIYYLIEQLNKYEEPEHTFDFSNSDLENFKIENLDNANYTIRVLSRVLAEKEEIYSTHPLKEFINVSYSNSAQESISKLLRETKDKLSAFDTLNSNISTENKLRFANVEIISDMVKVIEERNMTTNLDKAMWNIVMNRDFEDYMTTLNNLVSEYKEIKSIIETKYTEQIHGLPLASIRQEYLTASSSLLFKTGKMKKALVPLNAVVKNGHFVDVSNADREFSEIVSYLELKNKVDTTINILESNLNYKFTSFDRVDAVNDIYEFVKVTKNSGTKYNYTIDMLYSIYDSIKVADPKVILESVKKVAGLNDSVEKLSEQISYDFSDIKNSENFPSLLSEKLERWENNIDSWREYDHLYKTIADLSKDSLNDFKVTLLDSIIEGKVTSDKLENMFMYSVLKSLSEKLIKEDSILSRFSSLNSKEQILEYNKLINELEDISSQHIKDKIHKNLPINKFDPETKLELAKLNKIIRSKGRGTSIRKIFQEHGKVIKDITPCMLMSPLSVAQYIDLDFPKFDLVIFDEASQIKTGVAVGAMSRAKNCIIVGDPNQMPPTDFFSSNKLDEENIHIEDLESLLEDCLAINMPQKYLTHHYRSASESLIAFSNSMYYKNKMLTFPGTSDHYSKVSLNRVADGVYDRGVTRTNRKEAETVVAEIVRRLEHKIMDTIGVVTFNTTQQELIDDLLQGVFLERPALERIAAKMKEPIFIKNLENVQGDERDVILFSITFAKDINGKFIQNFGPIGKKGGWRRLNVAVSRSRKEMMVFSSIGYEDINISTTTSEGVVGLKRFLEFAKNGVGTLEHKALKETKNDQYILESLRKDLEGYGYQVAINFGVSKLVLDLVIKDKEKDEYIAAIILDGPSYKNLNSARDRNRLLPGVLEDKQWAVQRVWVLDYLNNKDKVISEILSFLEKTLLERVNKKEEVEQELTVEAEKLTSDDNAITGVVEKSKFDILKVPYEKYEVQIGQVLGSVYEQEASTLAIIVNNILSKEAPIGEQLLFRRIMEHYNEAKITSGIRSKLEELLEEASIKGIIENGEKVYYGEVDKDSYNLIRVADEKYRRDFEEIPFKEVSNVILYLLSKSDYNKQNLLKEGSTIFGFGRLTQKIQTRIDISIKELEDSKVIYIRSNGDYSML